MFLLLLLPLIPLIPLVVLSYKFYQIRQKTKENIQEIEELKEKQKQTQKAQEAQEAQKKLDELKQKDEKNKKESDSTSFAVKTAAITAGLGAISSIISGTIVNVVGYNISHPVAEKENAISCPNEPLKGVVAGSENRKHKHVIADTKWGYWKPEKGYTWKTNNNQCDLEVEKE
ncbi:hypothetical protein [Nostoc sp. ChiQUE01b]|uniref:hypothetical protein n=1 Tax=Nostoc sp. ChiQUE01b TaxID=3075376 RepID=UPI002AD3EA74|nr:hypothetical protein [Nostoc sp. ChiQUE01b]MDZ8262123.1 hypothetical protein [Nostoc sp. ChiQUE01b]